MMVHTLTRCKWHFLVIALLLLLSSCNGKNNLPEIDLPYEKPTEKKEHTVTICENVFDSYLYGDIKESETVYLNSEDHIALRETDVIINKGTTSSFWVKITLNEIIPDQNYSLRYELHSGTGNIFRSESFTFSSESNNYTTFIQEELNPEDRKKISAGEWTVNIFLNNNLLDAQTITILSAIPGQDVSLKEYKWKDFQFQYPWYCTIEDDKDITSEDGTQFRLVKLIISNENRIGLYLHFTDDWIPPEEEVYRESPAMANMMLGLPVALKNAEPAGPEAIALSAGSIELVDGFNTASRFVIFKPDTDTFTSMELFHKSVKNKMFFGILFTEGFKGKRTDTLDYFGYIDDTYAIIRSISMPELESGEMDK